MGIRLSDNQLLEVQNLHTGFRLKDDYYDAVDDVSFTLDKKRDFSNRWGIWVREKYLGYYDYGIT